MCAIVVYGESEKENKLNASSKTYRLGNESVKEKSSYEHLGLTTFNSAKRIERRPDFFYVIMGKLSVDITYEILPNL